MESLTRILNDVSGFLWSWPLSYLLLATGCLMTIRLGFVQFLKMRHACEITIGRFDNPADEGEINHFRALTTALSATIGTGNIVGVATAITAGGPGAVFWMWMTALFGMALKYSCCTLAQEFRHIDPDGTVAGGPMYYLQKGLNWGPLSKGLGVMFAVFALIASFGIGNMTQSNSIANALNTSVLIPEGANLQTVNVIIGLVLAVLVGVVIIGGVKRIAEVTVRIVPLMAIVYITGCLIILATNLGAIPEALKLIFVHAFKPTAAIGGVVGYTFKEAFRFGVARGVFSNESGLGSAPMAHAPAKTSEPVREGLVAMLGPFIDTIVICSMTAIVIISSGQWETPGLDGAKLTKAAFEQHLPSFGRWVVMISLLFFTYSTMISWSYYGDRCARFLFGQGAVLPYRVLFLVFIVFGAVGQLTMIWTISDITNALMAFPNLIGILAMSGHLVARKKDYFSRKQRRFRPTPEDVAV